MQRALFALPLLVALAAASTGLRAQSLFDPAAQVNDGIVTNFEVLQRQRLLTVLRRPDTDRESALQSVIDDRLRLGAAEAAGIVPTTDEVALGVDEFAQSVALTGEELVDALSDVQIAPETVRDYIRAQLAWGDLVRTRFSADARPSDPEIDRALALGTGPASTRVLLSEIILPVTPELAATSEERAVAFSEISSFTEFETAARRFSVGPSRNNGGRLDWLPLAELPQQIAPVFLSMQPGEVTEPILLGNALAVFQLRAIEDRRPPPAPNISVDILRVVLPAGTDPASARARALDAADTCMDVYPLFPGATEAQISRDTLPPSDLAPGLRQVVDGLDAGEIGIAAPTTGLSSGTLVMLCGRTEVGDDAADRSEVARRLFARRLADLADAYLGELEADAFIVRF